MDKETLVERLNLLDSGDWVVEVPLEILYDDDVWKTGGKEVTLCGYVERIRAPDEVYTKLNELNERPHSFFGIRDGLIKKLEKYSGDDLN